MPGRTVGLGAMPFPHRDHQWTSGEIDTATYRLKVSRVDAPSMQAGGPAGTIQIGVVAGVVEDQSVGYYPSE